MRNPQPITNKDFSVANQNNASPAFDAQRARETRPSAQAARNTNEESSRQNEQVVRAGVKNREQNKRAPVPNQQVDTDAVNTDKAREQNRRAIANNSPAEVKLTSKGKSNHEQAQKNARPQQQTPRGAKEQPKQTRANPEGDKDEENLNDKFGNAIQMARDNIFQRMENIEKALTKKDSSTTRAQERERSAKSNRSEDKKLPAKQSSKTRPEGINVANNNVKQLNQSPGKAAMDQLRSPFTAKTEISTATSPNSTNLVARGRLEKNNFSRLLESSQVDSPHTGQTNKMALKADESPEARENVEESSRGSYQALRQKKRLSKDATSMNQPNNVQQTKKSAFGDTRQEKNMRYGVQGQYYQEEKPQPVQRFDLSKKSKTRNINYNEVSKTKINQNESAR